MCVISLFGIRSQPVKYMKLLLLLKVSFTEHNFFQNIIKEKIVLHSDDEGGSKMIVQPSLSILSLSLLQ